MDLMNESYSIEIEKVKEIIPMSYIIRSEISEELIAVVVAKVRGKITYILSRVKSKLFIGNVQKKFIFDVSNVISFSLLFLAP